MTRLCDQSDALLMLELSRRLGLSWDELKGSIDLAQHMKRLHASDTAETAVGELTDAQIAVHPEFSGIRSPIAMMLADIPPPSHPPITAETLKSLLKGELPCPQSTP